MLYRLGPRPYEDVYHWVLVECSLFIFGHFGRHVIARELPRGCAGLDVVEKFREIVETHSLKKKKQMAINDLHRVTCGIHSKQRGHDIRRKSNAATAGSPEFRRGGRGQTRRAAFDAMSYRLCLLVLILSLATSALAASGEPAPRFNAKTTAGEKFTNDSLKGHVVLLQFWTTWCPYCRSEQPLVDSLDREFRDQGLVVLAVDVNESKKTVKRYLEQNPRACRIVLTEDTNLAAMYAAVSYPIYVVIDRDGNVVATQHGARGEHALRSMLARAGLSAPE